MTAFAFSAFSAVHAKAPQRARVSASSGIWGASAICLLPEILGDRHFPEDDKHAPSEQSKYQNRQSYCKNTYRSVVYAKRDKANSGQQQTHRRVGTLGALAIAFIDP
ncbi:protein of unknown function [uncultured Sphingopyxis sp.]|uniref:Uncharacterized protein n=1 Tax=uncultured Sphingopyxis sp. TaxID=310581 RepID=A0A1Y5PSY8_9SPHN|nr:protein of unknown function [uncultured Sphingopyxis sp.]